jgi:hypothetical protein
MLDVEIPAAESGEGIELGQVLEVGRALDLRCE